MEALVLYAVSVTNPSQANLQARVVEAAESVLKHGGSVGPLELFQRLGWLQPVHVEAWRKGNEHYRVLEQWIQVGQGKRKRAVHHFNEWAKQRSLRPVEVPYTRQSRRGIEALQVTEDGQPERERFYHTVYAPADLSKRKTARLTEKLNKTPELVVFQTVREQSQCSECGAPVLRGEFLFMENGQPLCLTCADLDHLVFLPAGDTALSRRARKNSPLNAVVVRFNRARKRHERQGLLVTSEAIDKAEVECAADAPQRAAARVRAAVERTEEDRKFVGSMTQAILARYPACPPDEARRIAGHTGQRRSGRVGRSAAGRALDPRAIGWAVIAHIRHQHTDYDQLLMQGAARLDARTLVRDKIEQVLANWTAA